MVPLNVLRDIAANLVNIHGQQDNQAILNIPEHIGFLDEYAGCAELYPTAKNMHRQGI